MKLSTSQAAKTAPVLLSLLVLVICFLAFSPGAMTWDSLEQLRQARLNEYGDWHPPLMAFMWHLLLQVNYDPGVMLLFHMLMLWFASVFLYYWSYSRSRLISMFFLLTPLLPWIINFQFVIWKDVGLAYSWILAVAIAVYFSSKNKFPIVAAVVIGGLFLYGFLVRSNSITGAIFLLPFLVACIFKKNTMISFSVCLLLNLALFALVPSGVNTLLRAESTHPLSYVMFDDVVALELMGKNVSDNLLKSEDISKLESCEHIKQNIVGAAFCVNERFEYIRKNQYSELKVTWASAVSQYPKSYLEYRFNAFVHLLRSPLQKPYYSSEFRVLAPPYMFDSALQPKTVIAEKISDYVSRSVTIMPFLFTPFFWIILSTVLSAGLRIIAYAQTPPLWMLPLSGLTYVFGYYPTTPAADFRYVYWACIICTISTLILLAVVLSNKVRVADND